jgi:type IV pilus assembly protein PilV
MLRAADRGSHHCSIPAASKSQGEQESRRKGSQHGASLIEVMVAIVVLSIGMLSMAWQHAVSLKYDKMSQFRGVATQLASELADRVRANVGALDSYVYSAAYPPGSIENFATNCVAGVCNGAQMAAFDLVEFRNAARRSLPDGGLLVVKDPLDPRALTIWVMWRDPEAIDSEATSASLAALCPAAIGTPAPMPQCMPLRVLL